MIPRASLLSFTPAVLVPVVGLLLVGLGAFLGVSYCEYRRVTEVQQLTEVTKGAMTFATECMATLRPTVGAAVIFARTHPSPVALTPAVRDSLRALRWTTP